MRDSRHSEPFAELFGDFADRFRGDHWQPDIDVVETEGGLVVRAELAGVRREELRVTVDGDVLRLSGRRESSGAAVVRLHQMEIASGPFERRVRIPIDFDRERVTAHLAEGLLTVTLPRRTPQRRKVAVEDE